MTAPTGGGAAPPRPAGAPRRNRSPFRNYLLLLVVGFALIVSWDELGFFVFLLLLGGVLSYLGDQLGTYSGKNRLSLFGLRPKHTAGLINLMTGILITAITFGGAVWMSEDVRVAVFRVGEMRREAADLRRQQTASRRALEGAERQMARAHVRFQAAQTRSAALEEENRSLEAARMALASEKADLETQRVALAEENRALGESNTGLEARRAELDRTIREKLGEIRRLNRRLETKEIKPVVISRGQVLLEDSVAVPMDVTTPALETLIGDLTDRVAARVELLDVRFDGSWVALMTRHGVARVRGELDRFRGLAAAAVERGELESAALPKEVHVSAVSTRNVSVGEHLARIGFDIRPNLLVYRRGEEVARTVLEADLTPEQLLDQLLYFDQQVRSVLRERGVSAGVLRRGQGPGEPGRLLELVRLVDAARRAGGPQLVRCRVEEDLYAFGEPRLAYGLDAEAGLAEAVVVAVGDGGDGGSGGEPGVPPRGLGFAYDPPSLDAAGFELVLPEPTLTAETLLQGPAPGLATGPPPRPEGR